MPNGKSLKLWTINVISFILFVILCRTGLINWLVFSRGYEARGNFLVFLRHFFIAIHEWVADIHGFDRNPYCLALALYKIQFKKIWYHEIANIVESKPDIF